MTEGDEEAAKRELAVIDVLERVYQTPEGAEVMSLRHRPTGIVVGPFPTSGNHRRARETLATQLLEKVDESGWKAAEA